MKTNRNVTLDVAKGLTLLTLPAIHSTLFYSIEAVQLSAFGTTLAFIAENAAPVFMLTMGIAITIGPKKNFRKIISRCLKLLLLGYLLNLLKFILPQLWNGIPLSLFTENGLDKNTEGAVKLFFMNDILQLAAISYFICAIIYKSNRYHWWAALVMMLIILISPLIWQVHSGNLLLRFMLAFINGEPPITFFPLFPWLTYPMAGLIVGYIMKITPAPESYRIFFFTGTILLSFCLLFSGLEPASWQTNFYRLGPVGTCFHLGIALISLCLCSLFNRLFSDNPVISLLTLISKNVTMVYMIQWVLVCWILPLFGYHQLKLPATIAAICMTTTLTVLLTYLCAKFNRFHFHIKK